MSITILDIASRYDFPFATGTIMFYVTIYERQALVLWTIPATYKIFYFCFIWLTRVGVLFLKLLVKFNPKFKGR